MKTTREFFGGTIDELLDFDREGNTIEEHLLFGHGENVTYFDDLKEYEVEREDFEKWLDEMSYKIKDEFETVNGRIAVVLIR